MIQKTKVHLVLVLCNKASTVLCHQGTEEETFHHLAHMAIPINMEHLNPANMVEAATDKDRQVRVTDEVLDTRLKGDPVVETSDTSVLGSRGLKLGVMFKSDGLV
jgi:hypothetical protein